MPSKQEKMLEVTSRRGNANQNHKEVPLHPSDHKNRKIFKNTLRVDMWRKGSLVSCWWDVNILAF